ncbi:hypothetical protein C8Q80DRAFT_1274557 [Daedaleopsis nitida]|nr:hypothetical protein C8Q80DRAFT_1274557 [Daedaleopsis nitida]
MSDSAEEEVTWEELHPPFEYLPTCYLPSVKNNADHALRRKGRPVPLFFYGIGLKTRDAIAFAKKHRLHPDPEMHGGHFAVLATYDWVVCRARLRGTDLVMPCRMEGYDWVIQLYTNQTYKEGRDTNSARRVAKAIEILGEYAGPTLWWWASYFNAASGKDWPSSWQFPDCVAPQWRARVSDPVWKELEEWENKRMERERERGESSEEESCDDNSSN